MTEDLTLKAISAYNGNLHNGMTAAIEAVVALVLEEAHLMLWSNGDFDQAIAIRALTQEGRDD